jgi:hypothetical protein
MLNKTIILFLLFLSLKAFSEQSSLKDSSDFHNQFYFNIPNSIGYKHTFFHRIELGLDIRMQIKLRIDSIFAFDNINQASLFLGYPIQIKNLIISPRLGLGASNQKLADNTNSIDKFFFEVPLFWEVWKNDRYYIRPYISFFTLGFGRGVKMNMDLKAMVEIGVKF